MFSTKVTSINLLNKKKKRKDYSLNEGNFLRQCVLPSESLEWVTQPVWTKRDLGRM